MKNRIKARRYAEALYDAAVERGHEDLIERELMAIRQAFSEPSDIVQFLQDPKQWMHRARIIKSTFMTFSSEVVKILLIMVEHHAEVDVPHMVDHYLYLLNEQRGIGVGKVLTVKALSPAELTEIETHFAEKFGYKELTLANVIDEDVLGGFKIVINQRVYDASVKKKLKTMRQNFVPLYKR
ncbi:ATP synthase F1 subcomplex delta subunit [Streptohalobacillus salinus]|uniref:ATP synthase subunit delta n=1 Tax=Streptohalobacillus salinus TaxID=621096 RepID=A0A2V3WBV7_9BACI|nr:ATP synthase F1 subunit delta [Streptohalobacillus salinus]PXW92045.1 ATP synthase F1 subcomplex delta subunit [Streptohalobacillus salinus]